MENQLASVYAYVFIDIPQNYAIFQDNIFILLSSELEISSQLVPT